MTSQLTMSALAGLFALAPALVSAQAAPPQIVREANPDLTAPGDISPNITPPRFDCDKPKLKNGERPLYTVEQYKAMMQPELSISAVSLADQKMTSTGEATGDVTFKFLALVDNTGRCDAKTSRMKAILKLSGGRWLAEDRVDVAVKRLSDTTVTFEMTIPYDDLLVDCELTRSDWLLTTKADFRDVVSERDETNNSHTLNFTTASGNVCSQVVED